MEVGFGEAVRRRTLDNSKHLFFAITVYQSFQGWRLLAVLLVLGRRDRNGEFWEVYGFGFWDCEGRE